jgi:hypothetical protein
MKLWRKPTLPLGPTNPRRTVATKDAPSRHADAQARSHICVTTRWFTAADETSDVVALASGYAVGAAHLADGRSNR